MTNQTTDAANDDLKQATKRAFDIFVEKARALASKTEDAIDEATRQDLHDAYIDYVALRTAARGSWGHRRRARFRRFAFARLAMGLILFMPLWLAAILIIADRL